MLKTHSILSYFILFVFTSALGCGNTNTPSDNDNSLKPSKHQRLWLKFQMNIAELLPSALDSSSSFYELSLIGSPVSDSLVKSLPVRNDIEILDLSQTQITQDSIVQIPNKFPNLRILYCDFTAVDSIEPLLKMPKIKEVSMYGTHADSLTTVKGDTESVYFRNRILDNSSLKAIQLLTENNILLSPGNLGINDAEARYFSDMDIPTEYINVNAWSYASAIANGTKEWSGDPQALKAINDIDAPIYLTLDFPQAIRNRELAYSQDESSLFFDQCYEALYECNNIIGLSLQNAKIDLHQWLNYIDALDVKISNMRYVTPPDNALAGNALLSNKSKSLLVVEYHASPVNNINISELLSFPSLKVIYLDGNNLAQSEHEIISLSKHSSLKVIYLPGGTLSDEGFVPFERNKILINPIW